MNRLVMIGVIVSIALIVVVLSLIRTRRLQERHAIVWLVAATVIVVIGVSSPVLEWVSDSLGIAYPPSALFLIIVSFLGLALLDCVITIARLTNRVRRLAQQVAILDEGLRRIPRQTPAADDGGNSHAVSRASVAMTPHG